MDKYKKEIEGIIDYILEKNSFIVSSHVNPDGDNIGSSLAIYRFLKKLGKDVEYVLDDEYPSNLRFLYDEKAKKSSDDIKKRHQTVIALDSGSYERICVSADILEKAENIICIDHHVTNGKYAKFRYIDTEASSTCELVYNIIRFYEEKYGKDIIDESIATPLYAGLTTDTGNFQYSNTKSSSFYMAADLLNRGADKFMIINELYQNNSISYYKILGETLKNMEIHQGKISIGTVTKKMLDYYGVEYGDIDAITPYTRDIKGIELGIFVKEKEMGEIKVSLRSKKYVDCTEIAKVFGGGGHVRASGCTIKDVDVKTAKEMLLKEAKKHI